MAHVSMDNAVNWEDPDNVKIHVAKQLLQSRLSLVLGAGVSMGFGLPSWDDLLNDLSSGHTFHSDYVDLSAPAKAKHVKREVYKDESDAFKIALKSALYQKASLEFDQLQGNPILSAIGALVMASSRGSVSNVISFNFDNILELYLRYYGFTVDSHSVSTTWASSADVEILHPHGFLPYGSDKDSDEIVIDTVEFHRIMHKDEDWKRRIYSILSSTFTIFIGLSGEDSHLDMHLQNCSDGHIAKRNGAPYWGICFTTDADSSFADRWRDNGVHPVALASWDNLPPWLFEICQKSANNNCV